MTRRNRSISLTLLIIFLIPDIHASTWRISATEVKYKLAENSQPGQIFGIVTGLSSQKSVTNALGAPSQFFQLDPITRELSLKTEIDAEKICALATRRDDDKDIHEGLTDVIICNPATGELSIQLDVNVLLSGGGLQEVFKVTVEILDVDDNPPRFDSRIWKRHLKEALYRKGRKIDLPKARDVDLLPEHRAIQYSLEPNSPTVMETFHFEVFNSETPTLILLKDLDAETQEYFNMTLVAFSSSSGTSDQVDSRLQIEIYVIDMNDNEPYFDQPCYNVTVPEDTLPGSVIFQLNAHDEDRGAQLDYSLVEVQGVSGSQSVSSIFEVEKSGRVVLRRSLDFESWKSYTLPISVTDGDFTTETILYVVVTDVNDEAPRFEINPIHLSAEEGTSAKRLIGQVRVYDPDSMEVNGVVRCNEPAELAHRQVLLFSPDPQAHPSVGRYDLQTRIELDREGPDTLPGGLALIRLICWDGNEMIHPSSEPERKLTSTLTATLTIRDINDNPPMFQQPIYHVTLAENNHIGAKIIQVQAQDPDDGENAEITYSLLDRANFHVNPVSGWITATMEFDREKRDSYQVSIIATDNGSQRLTGSALLNVTILDQNDNPPQLIPCDKMSDPLVVWENSAPGTFIGNLIATDADIGRNGEIVFRLPKKLASSASHFELRPNGTLYTSLPLDREQKATYELLVEVRDRGTPNVLSSTETVCITVLDGNDNAPHFVLPDRLYSPDDRIWDNPIRKREFNEMFSDAGTTKFPQDNGPAELSVDPSLRVSLQEIQGQFVTRLQATDPDEGANGRVIYGLKRHAQSRTRVNRVVGDFLGVDGNTGEVWLKRALQEDDLGPHLFIVSASDQGSPESRSESKVMLVSVENIPPRSLDGGGASSSFIASSNGSGEGGIFANLFQFKFGERKNALILVGLISVSVILAIALVAAMICMLKPCRPFSRQSQRFFNQNQMSSSNGYNSAILQAHTNVNGGVISLQEARLIDNSSAENFGSVAQDYGYGTTLTPVDISDGECWLGTNGKFGTYRIVNADSVSSASEEGFNKVPQLWNKYHSMPRENLDRCDSPTSLKQKNVCGASNAAGAIMTPLREADEKTHEHRPSGHWTPMKLAFESGNNGPHMALPVTLLPAVCLRSTGENTMSANNPFVSQSPTTFRPGVKLDVDVKAAEHASDSGQGGSDEDLQSQSLTQPPPVIKLVQLSCEFGENPWRRAAGGESLCSEDYFRLPNSNFLNKSINTNNPEDKVVVSEHLILG